METRIKVRALSAEQIYMYLATENEMLDKLIMCNPQKENLTTTDQALYEALGSIESFNWRKLVKLLETTDIISVRYSLKKQKTLLTEERVKNIRKMTTEDGHHGKQEQSNRN